MMNDDIPVLPIGRRVLNLLLSSDMMIPTSEIIARVRGNLKQPRGTVWACLIRLNRMGMIDKFTRENEGGTKTSFWAIAHGKRQ